MLYQLPNLGKEAIALPHFPTRHQAFIFRAAEYVPISKIAEVIKATEKQVRISMEEMGLPNFEPGELWLNKGYITIIRRTWHILPYSQLLKLLGMDEEQFAVILKEEDFLDVKLGDKPICEDVVWRELTDEEKEETKKIKEIISTLDFSGKAPFDFTYQVPKISFSGKEKIESRIIYAFSGLYQNAFEVDSESFCPDAQLEAYQNLGINGIWTQGVLSQLAQYPFDTRLSVGYEKRIERMRKFTERLDKFGIKLYLYVNEPRYMPKEFFEKAPDIKGHERNGHVSLCTSTERVLNYLTDSVESICRAVPLLGGFFLITRSENQTNCYSHSGGTLDEAECNCPRCKKRGIGEVIGDTVGAMLRGARKVSEDIKLFAWSWRWDEHYEDIIRHLPKGTILLSQSELDVPFEIGGISGRVLDYSMSINGPGEKAKREWTLAKKLGLECAAKVQINTTWEASTVPVLPISPSIEKHIEKISENGVQHLLLSWTLGGYPSKNISAAAKYFYENCDYSDDKSPYRAAEEQFTKAFSEFPFHITTLYKGPQNAGPSTLLFEKPTGYGATMTCFAYDDLRSWRSIYPVNVLENQFSLLCQEWEKGLSILPGDGSETEIMAKAAYCLFKSSLNQIRFIRARDDERWDDAVSAAKDELEIAKAMLSLMNKNAAIGYEAANHYYFSKGQIAEKILNCNYIINLFSK